jgi:hypothetical protein
MLCSHAIPIPAEVCCDLSRRVVKGGHLGPSESTDVNEASCDTIKGRPAPFQVEGTTLNFVTRAGRRRSNFKSEGRRNETLTLGNGCITGACPILTMSVTVVRDTAYDPDLFQR